LTQYAAISKEELLPIFKTLNLSNRRIELIDHDTKSMTSLMSLDVSSNAITTLKNLPTSLLSLVANNNYIPSLDSLPPLPALVQLGLAYNSLAHLPYNFLAVLPELMSLDLSYNQLADLDEVCDTLARSEKAQTIKRKRQTDESTKRERERLRTTPLANCPRNRERYGRFTALPLKTRHKARPPRAVQRVKTPRRVKHVDQNTFSPLPLSTHMCGTLSHRRRSCSHMCVGRPPYVPPLLL